MAKKKTKIQIMFAQRPECKELYKDVNGKIWANKATAEAQGGEIEIIKRTK